MFPSDALPIVEQAAMLAAWLADRNVDAVVCLFTNDITPDETTVIGDLIEPVGSWYTPVAVVFDEVRLTEDNGITVTAVSQQYNYTGTDAAEVVRGYFVKNVTPARMLSARKLQTPVSMGTTLDSVIVQPSITLKPVV